MCFAKSNTFVIGVEIICNPTKLQESGQECMDEKKPRTTGQWMVLDCGTYMLSISNWLQSSSDLALLAIFLCS